MTALRPDSDDTPGDTPGDTSGASDAAADVAGVGVASAPNGGRTDTGDTGGAGDTGGTGGGVALGEPWTSLESSYASEFPELVLPFTGDEVPEPALVVLNEELAASVGLPVEALTSETGVGVLSGSVAVPGTESVALAYAGHQFGNYSPRLGDGRALLLGELVDPSVGRFDIHLKGSGRTPFSRGGDGKATIGPMLREYVISEAMAALGVPTTRSLAVCSTGESIYRDRMEPGAVLARLAASHIRVGTFEYAVRAGGDDLVRRLADHSIRRHHPEAADADNPYRALLAAVVESQAELVSHWMLLGFIHGVMNTDNMTISGEGIDYGPCAFMDRYDPDTVFSSIDHGGRYRFGNQPSVAVWNLSRFAETLLGLLEPDSVEGTAAGDADAAAGGDADVGEDAAADAAVEVATAELQRFAPAFEEKWRAGMARKLGLVGAPADDSLVDDLLSVMADTGLDWTSTFRSLADELRQREGQVLSVSAGDPIHEWTARWVAALEDEGAGDRPLSEVADAMDWVNPLYIPRNHLVHEALEAANEGDLAPFGELFGRVTAPFTEVPGAQVYAQPAPDEFASVFRTFCGT